MSIIEIGAIGTALGLVIAAAQVYMAVCARRNSHHDCYGLPPIALMRGIERPHDAFANGRQRVVIKFELWNRQTYPIVLLKSHVVAADFEPDDYRSPVDDLIAPAPASHDEIIAPGHHGCYERRGTMPVFGLAPACAVHFGYFDPITNRIKEISGRRERETPDTLMRNTYLSVQMDHTGSLVYRFCERLSGVYSSLQSAYQQALVGVRSLPSRLRARLRPTASAPGPTELARRGWFRVSVPWAR
jgi:hypothetical protein